MFSIKRLVFSTVTFALTSILAIGLIGISSWFASHSYLSNRKSLPADLLIIALDNRSATDHGLPDSLTLYNLKSHKTRSISRAWALSKIDSSKNLVAKYLGPIDCEPFCNVQGLFAYSQLMAGDSDPQTYAVEKLRQVIQSEYQIPSLAVLAFDLTWARNFLFGVGPLEINVTEPIYIGGNGQNSKVTDFKGKLKLGKQTLRGEQLFWYARSRFQSNNEARMARQLNLLNQLTHQKTSIRLFAEVIDNQGLLL